MTDLRQAAQQALEQQAEPVAREAFEKWAKSLPNYMDLSRFEAGYSDCNTDYAWAAWKAALAQPQPQAEPTIWRDMVVVSLVREGIDKHKARELADHFAAQPAQEPDRRPLQAAGTHPAPCARHCEAKAFELEIRSLNSRLKQALPMKAADEFELHRLLAEERYTVRQLSRALREQVESPTFMGEPLITHTTPPAAQRQWQSLTDEQDRALCEAYCNDASDEYFKARPAMDFPEMRRIFYAGHRKAWITTKPPTT
jgi:hypothetical protein